MLASEAQHRTKTPGKGCSVINVMYRIGSLSPVNWLILGVYAVNLVRLSLNFKTLYAKYPLLATMITNVLLLGLSDSLAQSLKSAIQYKARIQEFPESDSTQASLFQYVLDRGRPKQVWLDEEGDDLSDLGLTLSHEEMQGDVSGEEMDELRSEEPRFTDFDFRRLACFSLYAFFNSFIQSPWYGFLRSAYNHDSKLVVVVQRVIADQVFYSPLMLCVFLLYLSVMVERKPWQVIKSSAFWENYVSILSINLCVWPVAQFTNFLLIPSAAQIPFSSSLSVLWNTYLSLNTS